MNRTRRSLFPVILLLTWLGVWPAVGEVEKRVVTVSHYPQLFLDDKLISRTENLKREIQQPVKHPANPLVVQDSPWEKRLIEIYGTVLYEPERDLFRMWYLAGEDPDAVPEYYMCYAESSDGIRWRKPTIGNVDNPKYPEHNIVIPGGHGMCVLRTPEDPDPNRRYRGLGGKEIAFSPDGLVWTMQPFESAGKNDTSSCVVRWKGEYLAYVRNQAPDPNWPGVMRAVALCASKDFEHWTPKETVFIPDKEDGYPWTQVYGMAVTSFGDRLIGFPWFLYLDEKEGNNNLGDMNVQLAVSRDGRNWTRVADRGVFLAPTEGTWDRGGVFPGTTFFVKDDLIYIYYTGVDGRHGEKGRKPAIGLATLPADRFVGLTQEEPSSPGILETPLLDFAGRDLVVNAEIEGRDIEIELLDSEGRVLGGFNRANSRLVPVDGLRYRVVWQLPEGEKDMGAVSDEQPVAVRFLLRKGSLFSFQVVDPER